MNKIMDGKLLRDIKRDELIEKVNNLDVKLSLAVISVGDNLASKVYISQKEKLARSIGYNFLNLHYDYIEEEKLIFEIERLNNDKSITGIIVQLPLPDYLNKDKIINAVNYLKDVDGLTDHNFLKLVKNEGSLIPCTPKGILSLLEFYKVDLHKNVVVVGRSRLVGLPLFHLLLNNDATVTICHSKTKNLEEITKRADILIVAVGKNELITKDMVKNDAIIVDVGINRVDDKLCGDVASNCMDVVSLITPVPGGVGPMTVISLMENVYLAHLLQIKQKVC